MSIEKTIVVELIGDTFIVSDSGETYNITENVKSWAEKIGLKVGDSIKILVNNNTITKLNKINNQSSKTSYNNYKKPYNKETKNYYNDSSKYMKPRHPLDQKEIQKSIALEYAVNLVKSLVEVDKNLNIEETVKKYYDYFLKILEA